MNMKNVLYIILAIIIYICGEYLWISKILFLELDSIIKHVNNDDILNKAVNLKSNFNFSPTYLYNLFKFIEHTEKSLNIDSLQIMEE